jgi:hypothetical protein
MNAAQKLIAIVEAAKDANLEVAERAYSGMTPESLAAQSTGYWSNCYESRQECLNRLRAERAEWQAARGYLDELLRGEIKSYEATKTAPAL